jgi:SAM-dependent methyltransferase
LKQAERGMAHSIVTRLIHVFGPCRLLHVGAADDRLLIEFLLAGCDAWACGSGTSDHARWLTMTEAFSRPTPPVVLVDLADGGTVAAILDEFHRANGLPEGLALRAQEHDRKAIEDQLFALGFRRHPRALTPDGYVRLVDHALPELACYERVPAPAAATWPVAGLLIDRPLHMDMLRESGARADAHVVRYALAAELVRPGDTVLDCACGLGYGTAVLAARSRGARFIGVDVDAGVIDYAAANYGGAGIEFRAGDAALLAGIPDASVDLVVSFETLEHVTDWQAAIAAFRRVLRPDGRLIVGVPDRWVDKTGLDPNPYHLHVFDWQKLSDGLADTFILEARYAQAAPGGFKLPRASRVLARVDIGAEADTEWIIVVASADPFAATADERTHFVHPGFGRAFAASGAAVVDFAAGYDNPFLYRVLVQMGERLGDDVKLGRLAWWAAEHTREGSADQGAAVCVMGYRAVETGDVVLARDVLDRIGRFRDASAGDDVNPHVARWRLSLAFVAGRLAEMTGDLDAAISWYHAAAHSDWRRFSALLATKCVAAAVHEARLHLARADAATARACVQHGLAQALAALQAPSRDIVGDPAQPIAFGLQELAEVADMGSQCANALAHADLWERAPGLFWSLVDVKRFGLASWARDLERTNAALYERLRDEQARSHALARELRGLVARPAVSTQCPQSAAVPRA